MVEKRRQILGLVAIASVTIGGVLAFTGCAGMESTTSDTDSSRTNNYETSRPVYRVEPPTMQELAGTYRSQDKTFHDSMITIFENNEFVWHSRTDTVRIFRGILYDLNTHGFSVKLNDGSGESFHFQFSPDARSFYSLDEYGRTVEEYRK